MKIDSNIISSIAAIITAFAAVAAFWWQGHLNRINMNFEYLWRLDEQFANNDKMLKKRKKIACALLEKRYISEIDDILDFFETIGLLIERGVLDKRLISDRFNYWAVRYWLVSSSYILEKRRSAYSPHLWIRFEKWSREMLLMNNPFLFHESEEMIRKIQEHLDEFLFEESNLEL